MPENSSTAQRQRTRHVAEMLLSQLVNVFLDAANELRWRLSNTPNPHIEFEDGSCRHAEDVGCSWRCVRRTGGGHTPSIEEIRAFIRERLGVAAFCYLDGYGNDANSIDIAPLIEALKAEIRIGAAQSTIRDLEQRCARYQQIIAEMTADAGLV